MRRQRSLLAERARKAERFAILRQLEIDLDAALLDLPSQVTPEAAFGLRGEIRAMRAMIEKLKEGERGYGFDSNRQGRG